MIEAKELDRGEDGPINSAIAMDKGRIIAV
jgi:hypothetical protein